MKLYVGISRDHSRSMYTLRQAAARDYNDTIDVMQRSARDNALETVASVVECGVSSGIVRRAEVNASVFALRPILPTSYSADGSSTPLFDSVGELIEIFEAVPDAQNSDVAFLLNIITDGQHNRTIRWSAQKLQNKMLALETTGRWTFTFRVPRGYKQQLMTQFGIPDGNILEWETTDKGMQESSELAQQATQSYFGGVSRGVMRTDRFYSDLSKVSPSALAASLTDISAQVRETVVQPSDVTNAKKDAAAIQPFCEKWLGHYNLGTIFYTLMKPEKIQADKKIVIKNKGNSAVYGGDEARRMIGLPVGTGEHKVHPGDHGNYLVYVQSASTNRLLPVGTSVLSWPRALA